MKTIFVTCFLFFAVGALAEPNCASNQPYTEELLSANPNLLYRYQCVPLNGGKIKSFYVNRVVRLSSCGTKWYEIYEQERGIFIMPCSQVEFISALNRHQDYADDED